MSREQTKFGDAGGPVECLGMTFESDDARREHFLERLKEHLADPEFRKQPGFPKGTDETILRLSDPPYYTACPNPFLREFVAHAERTEERGYKREAFTMNVQGGKGHALFKLHSYHTKLSPHAIVPYILHYTNPNDLILDGFCGVGMTGLAAKLCQQIPPNERQSIEQVLSIHSKERTSWGLRRVILNDLSPIASLITNTLNSQFDIYSFENAAKSILSELTRDIGWMYETSHGNGDVGIIDYTVWSEVRRCPQCVTMVIMGEMDTRKQKGKQAELQCTQCSAWFRKAKLERVYDTVFDQYSGEHRKLMSVVPTLIQYSCRGKRFTKEPDDMDLDTIRKISETPPVGTIPIVDIPYMHMTHERAVLANQGVSKIHHFHNSRQLQTLGRIWEKCANYGSDLEHVLKIFFEQGIHTMSLLNRYRSKQGSQSNQVMNGVYYIPSEIAEISPWYRFTKKISTFCKTMAKYTISQRYAAIGCGDCSSLCIEPNSVDYIFTDPPFGENIYYSDLNFLLESWHEITTATETEAIIDKAKGKTVNDYRDLMVSCFQEYHRVLKPGRWMSIVFSNSHASVWNALNDAIHRSGFIISTVTTMDTGQGSYRQVTSSAVKDNLIVNCFKPRKDQRQLIKSEDPEATWTIIREHLEQLLVWVGSGTVFTLNIERTPDRLFDRAVGLHLVADRQIPYSKGAFIEELRNRFVEREGMFFLPSQIPVFERKLLAADRSSGTLPVFMDRRSAIAWLRYELGNRPTKLQDLTPQYIAASTSWADKSEPVPELIDLLQDNFVEGENGRWKVPDPKKEAELERARKTRNLKRFNELVATKGRIKEVHADIVLVGFEHCYNENDLEIYGAIRNRLPATVLEEEQVSMYVTLLDARLNA